MAAARSLNIGLHMVRPGAAIPSETELAILDAQLAGPWDLVVRHFVESGGTVVAFAPHVDRKLIRRAREAGCQRVMAKSKFVQTLPEILAAVRPMDSDSTKIA